MRRSLGPGRAPVFANLYIYLHLIPLAFSLLMAVAFALVAQRLDEWVRGRWNVGVAILTGVITTIEMIQATSPSPLAARLILVAYGLLFVTLPAGIHAQYGGDGLTAERQRFHRRARVALSLFTAMLFPLLISGALDHGTRSLAFSGATSMVVAMQPWQVALVAIVPLAGCGLVFEPLLVPGPRQRERLLQLVPAVASPIVTLWEVGAIVGLSPRMLPIGGYFATLLGIQGVALLIERLGSAERGGWLAGYQLGERLGAGGMAEVFRATARGAGSLAVKPVAIKRLHASAEAEPELAAMFLAEIRLVSRLRHPNIVALHEAGIDRGQLYLAMELVDGVALSRVLRAAERRGERLSTRVVVELGIAIADALTYAHTLEDDGRPLELVHRDVSPQNILIDEGGVIKLGDFGIARTSERLVRTATNVIKGKLPYLAPEQLRGDPYDHRVDLFALGVVLFEAATGTRPADDVSELTRFADAMAHRPLVLPQLGDLPPELAEALRGALATEAADRLASADALRELLVPLRDELAARKELGRLVQLAKGDGQRASQRGEGSGEAATVRGGRGTG